MAHSSTSPFADVRAPAVAVAGYAVAAGVWLVAGSSLPGGRWLVVHLFTLGIVTNAVLAFTQHFAATLAHAKDTQSRWSFVLANLGNGAVLSGVAFGVRPLLGVGATLLSGVVLAGYLRIRRLRTSSLGTRFTFVLRTYERAHAAFIHGAVLGLLMGVGVVSGRWYGGVRLAHLHVNILGWAGLTLLATLVFFGPTVLRVRIDDGADVRAVVWLRLAATALTVTTLALLASTLPGGVGVAARVVAAAGLLVYAAGTVAVCAPVLRVAARARTRSASGTLLLAAAMWFPVAVVADAAVVASGAWQLLDEVGLAMLTGVFAQAVVAALGYVAPMLASVDGRRAGLRVRLERWPRVRPVVANIALVVGVAALAVDTPAGVAQAGFVVAGVALLLPLAAPRTW